MLLIHFLGSVYFAISLIIATLLFVIAGTFLESWSDSHLFAAHWTYNNPVFISLLWLYFINILFATLRRYPFKKKHIPFIITHIGLLMLLGGALVKSHFGLQGTLVLTEGTASNRVQLPHTYALLVESREKSALLTLDPKKMGQQSSPFEDLEISLIDWTPHAEQKVEGWIKDDYAHLLGFPPLPVYEWNQGALPISLKTPDYTIAALKTDRIREVAEQLSDHAIALVQTAKQKHYLITKESTTPLSEDLLLIFDKGFGGYGWIAELPPSLSDIDLIAPLSHSFHIVTAPRKKEEIAPCICLLVKQGQRSEIVTLGYDRHETQLKWPALEGEYLFRFQPQSKQIPSTIRLREARQINYPQSEQPLSFEGDLWVDGKEQSISMNHVHETREGYRLYLATLASRPFGAKRAQIVVNRDPGKYWLTYPGGVILAIGMLLLYLRKVYV